MHKYAEYMRNQVTELLTNYGKIDILWFDFSYSGNNGTGDKAWMKGKGKDDWEAEELIATGRAACSPAFIIDNRTEIEQDLWTPEQYPAHRVGARTRKPASWSPGKPARPSPAPGDITGTNRPGNLPKCSFACWSTPFPCGGNLLMNVGPTSRGYLDYRAEDALKVLRRLDEIQQPLHLRLHHGRTGAFKDPRRLPPAPRARTASACTCICSPIRSRYLRVHGLGGQGGIRTVPARRQRSPLHRRHGLLLLNRRPGGCKGSGLLCSQRKAPYPRPGH